MKRKLKAKIKDEYEPSEGTPQKGKDSTRPIDSTRFFETAQGINEIAIVK